MPQIKDKTTTAVQDKCRALIPLIGRKASEDLWTAYLFQDVDGKEEMEEQVDLLANFKLNTDVQNTTPIFFPPPSAVAAGEIPLGTVYYNSKDMHPFGLNKNDLMYHVGLFGATGTGKTNAAHILASEIHKQGIPLWVFEFKRSWRELRALPQFQDLLIYTVGRYDVAPITFNPLIPPEGVDPHSWIKKLSHAVSHSFFLGQGVLYLLEVILLRLYEEFGVFAGNPVKYPTFRDVLRLLRNYPIKSGRESLWLSSAMRAIHSLCFGQMDRIVNGQSNDDLKKLVNHAVIFEMDSLAHEDKVFFTECTMLWLYEHYQAKQVREKLQHVVILEEAHNIAGRQAREDPSSRAIVDIMFRQSREYGLGLVIIDQMPSAISKTALANVHCLLGMGVKEKADVVALAGAMLLDREQSEILGRLPLGTAIVRMHRKGLIEPFMLRTPLMPISKGNMSDEMIHSVMQPFIRQTEQPDDPGQAPSPKLTESEMAFLQDVAMMPDSGVVARYTRLGLSGRQGDKAKRSLIDQGLIEETEKLMPRGRTKVIRLTDTGKRLLEAVNSDLRNHE